MDVAEDLSQGLHSVFLGTRGLASTIRGQASLTLLVGQASIPNSRRSSAVCGGSTSNRGQTPTLRAQALTHFIVGKRTFFLPSYPPSPKVCTWSDTPVSKTTESNGLFGTRAGTPYACQGVKAYQLHECSPARNGYA